MRREQFLKSQLGHKDENTQVVLFIYLLFFAGTDFTRCWLKRFEIHAKRLKRNSITLHSWVLIENL